MTHTFRVLTGAARSCSAGTLALVLFSLAVQVVAAANVWDGGSTGPGDDYWGTAENWDDNAVPAFPAALTFGAAPRLAPSNNLEGVTVNGITFAAGAGAFALGGNPFTLAGNIGVTAGGAVTNAQTLNLDLTLAASPAITTTLRGPLVFNGAISGPYGLSVAGNGYVQFNGLNAYTGATVFVNESFVSIGSASPFGSGLVKCGATAGGQQWYVASGADRTITNSVDILTGRFIVHDATVLGKSAYNLALSGSVRVQASSDFYGNKSLTISGPISGGSSAANTFGLAAGKLSLLGNNTFTNTIRIYWPGYGPARTLSVNSDASLGHPGNGVKFDTSATFQAAAATNISLSATRTFAIAAGATATFDVPANSTVTMPGVITNSGALSKISAGTLALAGPNAYGGGTTLSGGVLNINADSALGAAAGSVNFAGSAALQAGATNVSLSASRTVNLTNAGVYTATFDVPTNCDLAVAGPVRGNAATNSILTKTGPGTLTLSGGSGGTALAGMNVLAGKVSVQGGVWAVAPAATADGTVFNVTGGATYEQTGGTNVIPYYACISQQYTGGVTTNMTSAGILSGGTMIGYELMVGRRNSAVMTISGDALLDLYSFKLGELAGFTTVCNLDGGVVACNFIASRGTNATLTTSVLNLNGGTIRAKGALGGLIGGYGSGTVSFLTTVNVKSGGAFIDSQNFAVTIPQILSHDPELGASPDGGLTKRGAGSLSLTTNNTYTGITTVEEGTLRLGVANALWASGYVRVSSNAVLDVNAKGQSLAGLGGSGLVTNNSLLSVTSGIAPGSTNAIGQLTLAATPASLGGTLLADVAANGLCDRLHVQGDLNLTSLALAVANPESLNKSARYVIASCAGTLTGPFAAAPLPQRWHVNYIPSTGEVLLSYNFGTLLTLQ